MGKESVIVIVLLVTSMIFTQFLVVASSEPGELLREHEGMVKDIVDLIEVGEKEAAIEQLNSLHSAVIRVRASLNGLIFEGGGTETRTRVTDPFPLPKGTYRVHFTTPETGSVKIFPLEVDSYNLLFNLFGGGQAAEGASVVYRSPGGEFVLEISNVSEPYELIFERLG